MRSLGLLAIVAGCTRVDFRPISLADLSNPRVDVAGDFESLLVNIEYDEHVDDACHELTPSFHATAGSAPIPVVLDDHIELGDETHFCVHSPLRLQLDPAPQASELDLAIADDTQTITAYLHDTFVRRTATFDAPDPLKLGDAMQATWAPVTDLMRYTPRVLLAQDGSTYMLPATADATHVRFDIPSPSDSRFNAGDAMLTIVMTDASDVLPCSNAQCTLHVERDVRHSLVLH